MKINEFKKLIKRDVKNNIPFDQDFVNEMKTLTVSISPSKSSIFTIRRLAFTFSFLLMMFFSWSIYNTYQTTTGVFTVDINPSVRIDVNIFNRVTAITAINQDGQELIDSMDYKKGNLDTVLNDVLSTSAELGYLNLDDDVILFGVSGSDYMSEDVLTNNISGIIDEYHLTTLYIENNNISIDFNLLLTSSTQTDNTTESTSTLPPDFIENFQDSITDGIYTSPVLNEAEISSITTYSYFSFIQESYQLSDAHITLIAEIYQSLEIYQTSDQFYLLLDMPIDELVELYQSIPSAE